ncbi:MAG: hypothetical protein AAGH99_00975 [Planctomycetota bacterium]
MQRQLIRLIHLVVSLCLGFAGAFIAWVAFALYAEYGTRGPNGEYLFDISDSTTRVFVISVVLAAFVFSITAYGFTVWLFRHCVLTSEKRQ